MFVSGRPDVQSGEFTSEHISEENKPLQAHQVFTGSTGAVCVCVRVCEGERDDACKCAVGTINTA